MLRFLRPVATSILLLSAIYAPAASAAQAAPAVRWPEGKSAAIVLTYDDALQSQLKVAVPQLRAAGLRGTFFLKADNIPVADMPRWRAVADAGNELGNHTLNHPCPRAMLPGRDHYATESYDAHIMLSEIAVMNDVLFGLDGGNPRTMSYPCSQTLVGGKDYKDDLRHSGLIKYARNGGDQYRSVLADPSGIDPLDVPSWGPVDSPDGPQLIAYAERVRTAGGLGVFQFHGVGGDYLTVSAEAHLQLLDYLKAHPEIWVVTFQEAMNWVTAKGASASATTNPQPPKPPTPKSKG